MSEGESIEASETRPTGKGLLTDKKFDVPETHDLLDNLFTQFPPSLKTHTQLELLTFSVIACQILVFFSVHFYFGFQVPTQWKVYFMSVFAFWRFAYNCGLGWLLFKQSQNLLITKLLAETILNEEFMGKTQFRKRIFFMVKKELGQKMGADYAFDSVPCDYNAWLLFRKLVDLILINDFAAYIIFSLTFMDLSLSSTILLDVLRWLAGVSLIVFNVWVKLDALRVVGDYAWCWGDFFFLKISSVDLVFDGVFEMVPHPMYSLGYAGFYGISLISNSSAVFFGSLFAHIAQFMFLYFVEEPHIQKIYSSGKQERKREKFDVVLFKNLDLFKPQDLFLVISFGWLIFSSLFLPSWAILFQALLWRIFHSVVLGLVLQKQSEDKFITKHFVKYYGGSNTDAFNNWKSVYNYSLIMTYSSFAMMCARFFDYDVILSGNFFVRQAVGILLIILNAWMSRSVYRELGTYGWYYGDFFITNSKSLKLKYDGIYRYLNNPEKSIGNSSYWGLSLMSGSSICFAMALITHMLNWWFLEYVESPNMKKLYGNQLRPLSGVEKVIHKNVLSKPIVKEVLDDLNKISHDVAQKVEKLVSSQVIIKHEAERILEAAKPKIDELLMETRLMLAETASRISPKNQDLEGAGSYTLKLAESNEILIGEPILFEWSARKSVYSPKDWIAVYPTGANPSKEVTTVASKGLFLYLESGVRNADSDFVTGKVRFDGEKSIWLAGAYEARIHREDQYVVEAISSHFEIKLPFEPLPSIDPELITLALNTRTYGSTSSSQEGSQEQINSPGSPLVGQHSMIPADNPNSHGSIVSQLIPLYQRALKSYPTKAKVMSKPLTKLGGGEMEARNVALAVKQLYGVDFHWKVFLQNNCTVERMAERIQEARVILAPVDFNRLEWLDSDRSIRNSVITQ